jgi:hypothetical protein
MKGINKNGISAVLSTAVLLFIILKKNVPQFAGQSFY